MGSHFIFALHIQWLERYRQGWVKQSQQERIELEPNCSRKSREGPPVDPRPVDHVREALPRIVRRSSSPDHLGPSHNRHSEARRSVRKLPEGIGRAAQHFTGKRHLAVRGESLRTHQGDAQLHDERKWKRLAQRPIEIVLVRLWWSAIGWKVS